MRQSTRPTGLRRKTAHAIRIWARPRKDVTALVMPLARAEPSNAHYIPALLWLTPHAMTAVTAIDEKPIAIRAAALVDGNLVKRQQ